MSTEEEARGYPVVLRLAGRLCVVVGGGEVARRKVEGLIVAGARIRIVAPQLHPSLAEHAEIEILRRPFMPEDLDGALLAVAATDDPQLNAGVANLARQRGCLVNIADDPEGSDFHLPAVLRRGRLTVAVSSSAASPAFAAQFRDHLAATIGPEWQIFAALAAALRQKRLTGGESSAYNRAVISDLMAADLPRLLVSEDEAAINRLLSRVTGVGITLADLGIHFGKGTT